MKVFNVTDRNRYLEDIFLYKARIEGRGVSTGICPRGSRFLYGLEAWRVKTS